MVLFLLVVVIIDVFCLEWFNLTQCFFDVAHNLELSGGVEGVASSPQQLHQVCSDIASAKVNALGCIRDRVSLVDRARMSHTISAVEDYTGCEPARIQ